MLFIWGSTSRVATTSRGQFFCPHCQTQSPYALERVSRYFTFFFIPLFATRTLGEYVRCQNCRSEMRREVLSLSREQIQQAIAPWECPICGNHNSPAERACLSCGAARNQHPPPIPGRSAAGPPPLPGQPGLSRAGRPEDPLSIIASPSPFAGAQPGRHSGIFPKILLGCGGLFILSFVALIAVAIFHPPKSKSSGATEATGKDAFEEASRSIGSNRDGVGHGNTPEAQKLAERLSDLLDTLGEKIPHLNDQETMDATHGHFIVYCQLNKDSAAFLIHVPNLRHYTTESKHEIAKLCYATACAALKINGNDTGIRKVAIATRGAFFYDTALLGSYPAPKDPAQLEKSGEAGNRCRADAPGIYPFFLAKADSESAIPETDAAPTAPATSVDRERAKASTPESSATKPPSTPPIAPATPAATAAPAASEPSVSVEAAKPANRHSPPDVNKPMPSWVPAYPGLTRPAHGTSREENGLVKGRTNFETTDPLDTIKDFYESKLKADGFEITEKQPLGRLFEKADIVAKKTNGNFTVHTEITQMKARTFVTVTFDGPADAGPPSGKQ